jgi:hypothetical protein
VTVGVLRKGSKTGERSSNWLFRLLERFLCSTSKLKIAERDVYLNRHFASMGYQVLGAAAEDTPAETKGSTTAAAATARVRTIKGGDGGGDIGGEDNDGGNGGDGGGSGGDGGGSDGDSDGCGGDGDCDGCGGQGDSDGCAVAEVRYAIDGLGGGGTLNKSGGKRAAAECRGEGIAGRSGEIRVVVPSIGSHPLPPSTFKRSTWTRVKTSFVMSFTASNSKP